MNHTDERAHHVANAIPRDHDAETAFYALWLDPTLTYSCAWWDDGEDDLHAAQLKKLDYHAEQVRAAEARRILDIGCGWGSLVRRLVEHHGVPHTVGLTRSPSQADYVASLGDARIEVHLADWADYAPEEPFDGIVSVGAFELFARLGDPRPARIASYRRFFEKCRGWLAPGKTLSLQTIAYTRGQREPTPGDRFVDAFPVSRLPVLAEIAEASDGLFEIETLRNDRLHHARTFRAWLDRFRARRARAVALVGEARALRFEHYLELLAQSFQLGTLALYRVTLRRLEQSRVRAEG
ncbi:class I SAM-dependent methyltransferase [Pendulispora albinea]|uniref:Class I SAM-dependent methyltransferase n=1 Tax=Pendulispora albinea TaxID=2741071 RepID=A0ABZ2LSQ9_9BACT